MPRDYRLISYLGEWQVCSKARRMIFDETRDVWIYGKERIHFCDVGREDAVFQLPEIEQTNFFGDRFTFAIDVMSPGSEKIREKVGGMNNVVAAQRAFDEVLSHHSKGTLLRLRQGGFVMREGYGKDDYRERVQRPAGGEEQ